jgi:hypothetical protein
MPKNCYGCLQAAKKLKRFGGRNGAGLFDRGDYMHTSGKQSIALLVIVAILLAPIGAFADDDFIIEDPQTSAAYMIGDAVVARPAGLVMTAAGFVLFLVASPFALIAGNAGEAWDAMVAYPAGFTFTRPLGDFD